MVLNRQTGLNLDIRELNTMDVNSLATQFFSGSEDRLKEVKMNPALNKFFQFIQVERDIDQSNSKYHLLWLENEDPIGLVSLSEIREGQQARINFSFFDQNEPDDEVVKQSVYSSVEKIFDKFNLNRLILKVDGECGQNRPEQILLDNYVSYPVGFVHVPDNCKKYVLTNAKKVKTFYFV